MAIQTPTMVTETVALDDVQAVPQVRARLLSPTLDYVLRRVGLYLITLWGSLTAAFFFFRLIPGDPIDALVVSLEQRGQYGTVERSEAIVEHYQRVFGLDGNLLEQYWRYFNRVLLHFDFGPSLLSYPNPASHLILRALPWTLGLLGVATILGWLLGVVGGTFVAWRRQTPLAKGLTVFSLILSHIPAYFVALLLVYVLAYRNAALPPNSAYSAKLEIGWSWGFVWSVVVHGLLPVMASVIVFAANWLISTRALVTQVLGEDYLTYAGAKGLSSWRILNRYVMRNAWIPQVAALGITLGSVVNGNVLVERLFLYPGLGNLLIDAIAIKDVNTAQAIISMLIFLVLTVNLLVDLALPLLDPRIKYER